MRVGFAGLGRMGVPIARNLSKEGFDLPLWNRTQDKARVFYCSIGHELDDLKVPQVTEIIRRSSLWAAARTPE